VQLLSRPENSAYQTVRNHEVMADGDAVHSWPRGSIILERVTESARDPTDSASRTEITIEQRVTTKVETADPRP
jgi:hypothetical protein